MKTATMIPAQAEHQLTQVADRFDHWRQTRTTPAEPIPPYLWEQAIALTATVPITRVATRLRVSGGELKKRSTAHHTTHSVPATIIPSFMEVTAMAPWPPLSGTQIELHRADGAWLRVHAHEPQLSLATLVRTFLETS
jgi:hypothetical protein